MEEKPRAKYVGRGSKLTLSEQCHPPHISTHSPTQQLSKPSPFGFMEASLHRHNWLNLWPLEIDSTSSAPPLPVEVSKVRGTEISNPLIKWLVLLASSPHPQMGSKSHHINISPIVGERGLLQITPKPPLWLWSNFRNWGQEPKYYNKRCSYGSENARWLLWLRKFQGLGKLWAQWMKTKIYTYYKSQCRTPIVKRPSRYNYPSIMERKPRSRICPRSWKLKWLHWDWRVDLLAGCCFCSLCVLRISPSLGPFSTPALASDLPPPTQLHSLSFCDPSRPLLHPQPEYAFHPLSFHSNGLHVVTFSSASIAWKHPTPHPQWLGSQGAGGMVQVCVCPLAHALRTVTQVLFFF